MIKDQMFLFPEYDFFSQKEKKIDFMYLDEIKNSSFTKKKYSDLPKKRYILWKTGGINSYMPDLGPIFPYIYDTLKEKMVYEEHINNDYDMFIPSLVYVVGSDSQTPAEKMACRK